MTFLPWKRHGTSLSLYDTSCVSLPLRASIYYLEMGSCSSLSRHFGPARPRPLRVGGQVIH